METQFRNLDRSIESQPMPPQFRDTKAMVLCNDCHAKSPVKYHWLGLKCAICHSYNTAQLSILSETPSLTPETSDPGSPAAVAAGTILADEDQLGHVEHSISRRHSIHASAPLAVPASHAHNQQNQRLGRSMSPLRGGGWREAIATDDESVETEDEEDVDFWGIEQPRSVTSAEVAGDDLEADDEDSRSEESDCEPSDDEPEDEDDFDLLGHR